MIIEYGKINLFLTMITGILSILLNKSYYGYLILLYSLTIGFHLLCVENITNGNILKFTSYPSYIILFILLLVSLYILYQSKFTETSNKIISISQLSLTVFFIILLKYGKSKFEILNEKYINYIPSLFLIGFFTSVSIIKDNQIILKNTIKSNY